MAGSTGQSTQVREPPSGDTLDVRRSIDELGGPDLLRLHRAFNEMMRLSDSRGYQSLAGIYGRHSQHQDPRFLAWNRAYLIEFEWALQSLESGVTLPWWDWATAKARGEGIPEAFATPTVDHAPNPLYEAEIDIADAGGDVPSRTSRELASPAQLPGEEDVTEVLAIAEFEDFARALENLHNKLHGWIGGTNGIVALASYDPFFWAYQASIDRIWWLWQQAHPEQEPPASISDETLAPFNTTVRGAWDAAELGYEYGPAATAAAPSRRLASGAANDRPAIADELSFSDYARAFAEIIASKNTTPPLTIGIYGQWGIGKSSLLQMITEEFRGSEGDERRAKVHVVEFNAWKYSANEKIWPALVREVMEHMEAAAQWTFRARITDTLKRNARRNWRQHRGKVFGALAVLIPVAVLAVWKLRFSPALILATIAAVGVPGLIKLAADTISNPVSRWVGDLVEQAGYGNELAYMREIHADLEFLTKQLRRRAVSKGKVRERDPAPRVLVMIDDLDRCDPEKAVEVLQAINLLLNFEVFVVCLGIDARVISAAVEAHYKQLLGPAGASGYEYLEKIVQIPFRIPLASPQEIAGFLKSQMPERLPENDGAASRFNDARRQGEEIDTGTRFVAAQANGPAGASAPEPERATTADLADDDAMFDPLEIRSFQELAPFIRRNPRHIKRLINVYRMVRTLATRRHAEEILANPKVTAAWIVICAQWPYTIGVILDELETILEEVANGRSDPEGEPLEAFYRRAQPRISAKLQEQIDDAPADFERLFEEVPISWEELARVQPYTLNFNPAIDEALRRGAPDNPGERAPD